MVIGTGGDVYHCARATSANLLSTSSRPAHHIDMDPEHIHYPARVLGDLVLRSADLRPAATAIEHREGRLTYAELAESCLQLARGLAGLGIARGERIAVYLPKQSETVQAFFGAALAGAAFVPINPLLKAEQVGHILADSGTVVLVTSGERLRLLSAVLNTCPDLRHVVTVGEPWDDEPLHGLNVGQWTDLLALGSTGPIPTVIDSDLAAILYTSGSTGRPKGVVLSQRNMVAGAESVAEYLQNRASDRLLTVLPFSFDYGFSQVSTAFLTGAAVVLMEYLLPRDVINAVVRDRITGLAAVPPLWIQLAQLPWPDEAKQTLRYITSSGGPMPRSTVAALRAALPTTAVVVMYGLTEAFRSTYLPPAELDRRPDSMGQAIPNVEILVLRDDGSRCAPGEPGELVHRGPLVAQGYWRDLQRTAERFRPLPLAYGAQVREEIAVFSGDLVKMDEDGFLYFLGRRDDMIKTSGYRVSPTEIEEVIYGTGLVGEAAAFGVPHGVLGQAIVVAVTPPHQGEGVDIESLLAYCRKHLPGFMVPGHVAVRRTLPRNPNGKIDRPHLRGEFQDLYEDSSP
jgi:acyl-CoA ligase (AMP-forming) (exosortase A-associated)